MSFKIYFEEQIPVVNHEAIKDRIKRSNQVKRTKVFLFSVETETRLEAMVFSLDPNTQAEYYIESESGVTLRMDKWVNNLIQNRST